MQVNNNSFYSGVLFELEKMAQTIPNMGSIGASVAKPAAPTATPPITTPSGTKYTPAAQPGQPPQVNNLRATNRLTNQAGLSLGWLNDMSRNHPVLTSGRGLGVGYGLDAYGHSKIDSSVAAGVKDPNTVNKDQVIESPFQQGFVANDTGMQKYINDPKREGSLGNVSHGFKQYDPVTNQLKTDWAGGVKRVGEEASTWMGQHPWLTAGIGGLGIAGLLAMFLNKNKDQQQQAPQQQTPQQAPLTPSPLPASQARGPSFI